MWAFVMCISMRGDVSTRSVKKDQKFVPVLKEMSELKDSENEKNTMAFLVYSSQKYLNDKL